MNKAFIAEETQDDLADEELEALSPVSAGKNYITPAGAVKIKNELQHLLKVERPEIVQKVSWAAALGDRSENADYIYNKRRLREIDRRVRFLSRKIDFFEIVDPLMQKGKKVLFGATLTLLDDEGQKKIFRIVGQDETDLKHGKISWVSPLGKALLQNQEGDVVSVKTPKGIEEYEILKVEYLPIPDENSP